MSPPSSSSTSSSKSFWPRSLVIASPHPSQLQGGRQLEGAPMCPCNACWECGSHTLAPPKAPKAPKEKKSPLQFLTRANSSKESVASDMRPLKQAVSTVSAASSVYGGDY